MFFAKSSSKFTFYAEKTLQNAIRVVGRLPNRILTIFQKLLQNNGLHFGHQLT